MYKRNKKTIVFALILLISFSSASYFIPKTESIEPYFTLVAYAKNTNNMDYFHLIKQQLSRIGVNLDIVTPSIYQIDHSGWYDLEILNVYYSSIYSPFHWNYYSENGTFGIYGYDESMDWVDELGTGRNEWYIKSGLEMIANDSEDVLNHCWEWQNYLLDEVLPCLPLFVQKNDSEYFQVLVYNLRETHPIIGSREPSPFSAEKSVGLSIRKAITYAINREEIRRVVLGDDYKIIDHPINPFLGNWCNPNVVKYCYNLDAARTFIHIAGYYYAWCGSSEPVEWLEWEAVCSRNNPLEPTIDVTGFKLVIACLGISTVTIISVIIFVKKRKKNKEYKV